VQNNKNSSRKRYWYPVAYIAIVIAVLLSYSSVRETMILQQTWLTLVKSNITLNFVLFLFLYGIFCDRLTKKMSCRKGWIIWGIGLMVLIFFFRFVGGFETILG